MRSCLQQVPAGRGRQCILTIETLSFTLNETLHPIKTQINYEIADPADDFPDGDYQVGHAEGRVPFVKSGGRYSEKKSA
jgi:hypothetical protein